MRHLFIFLLLCTALDLRAQSDERPLWMDEVGVTDTLALTTPAERAAQSFAQALRALMRDDATQARASYERTLELQPDHVGALHGLATLDSRRGEDSLALEELSRAVELDPKNYWLRRELAGLYSEAGREEEAIAQLERLTHEYPRNSELLGSLASAYAKYDDYQSVVRTLDRIELLEGKSEQLSMQKFRCYVRLKDERRAFQEIRDLAEEYPADTRYQVLVGDLYLDMGREQEALAEYQRIAQSHPDNPTLQVSLVNYYHATGEDSLAQAMLTRLLDNDQLDADTRYEMLQSLVYQNLQQDGDTAQVMPLLRAALARPDAEARTCELAARYMVTRRMEAAQVRPMLRQMLRLDPTSLLARSQLLQYAVQENDTAELIDVCQGAADLNLPDPVFYYYLGIGRLQQKRDAEAAQAFERGLAKTDDHTNLQMVTNMYSILGDLYHELGNSSRAYQMYDSCLLYRPDEALVLNNYAYYLSLEGKDLERAAEMSRRSLEKEGQNPTYLDTYAWVLFQQRHYEEARAVADSVLSLLGDSLTADDATLLEHAGDIHAKCGDTDRAMQLWQDADDLLVSSPDAADTKTLTARERLARKIKKRKYTE